MISRAKTDFARASATLLERCNAPRSLWLTLLATLIALLSFTASTGALLQRTPGGGDEGSGLGGTGLRPFLGAITQPSRTPQESTPARMELPAESTVNEIVVGRAPRSDSDLTPTDAIQAVAALELPSSPAHPIPADMSPQIEGFVAPATSPFTAERSRSADISIDDHLYRELQDNVVIIAQAANTTLRSDAQEANAERMDEPAENRDRLDWQEVSAWLAARMEEPRDRDSTDEPKRESQPVKPSVAQSNTLRRPALPAIQRARPIQRAPLLPPRIRPLTL